MSWSRNEPDPLEAMRRKLAEQERALSEQKSKLMAELNGESTPSDDKKSIEPPVWRLEDDGSHHRMADPAPTRKRNLAKQRQRDMILVIVLAVLFLALAISVWIAYMHTTAQAPGGV